jgi:Cu(I)/Ag(I) efflux system membrane fusion protein/cobalt-zinc-cadmium efflux system membrane fusion protein
MNRRIHIVAAMLAVVASAVLVSCGSKGTTPADAGATTHKDVKYHCAMHPSIVSDKPGNCPICSMTLVPINESDHEVELPVKVATKKMMYRSTMNPNEVSDRPGKDSMGMDMVPFEIEEPSEKTPAGLAAVSITTEARQRMGLTTGVVEKRALAREVRTSARIMADETRLYRVTVKVEGWVDKLFTATTGQYVKQGDPLLSVYSPDLLTLQNEYLTALRFGSTNLVASARRRLSLWDITDDQIDRLNRTGEAEKNLTLYAPASGSIIERMVLPGQKIMAGEPLLVIADLSRVWADADIYQSDLPYVKVGMPVELSLPYWPDKKFTGKVTFVSPTLDVESRTLKARLEIPNPELLLKPEMFATATLSYELGDSLAIPEAAVMRAAQHTYAFRDAGDGRLVPTAIVIGERSDGYYQLVSGLSEGDKVVTSANFLVDSESSMRAALEAMAGGAHQH